MAGPGQPPKFNTPEEIDSKVEEYFLHIKGESEEQEIEKKLKSGKTKKVKIKVWKRPPEYPTITGLALFMGFESRQSIYDYGKDSEFSYTIKKARLRIEAAYEQCLHSMSPSGAIFALKNFGWIDRQELKHEGIPESQQAIHLSIDGNEVKLK